MHHDATSARALQGSSPRTRGAAWWVPSTGSERRVGVHTPQFQFCKLKCRVAVMVARDVAGAGNGGLLYCTPTWKATREPGEILTRRTFRRRGRRSRGRLCGCVLVDACLPRHHLSAPSDLPDGLSMTGEVSWGGSCDVCQDNVSPGCAREGARLVHRLTPEHTGHPGVTDMRLGPGTAVMHRRPRPRPALLRGPTWFPLQLWKRCCRLKMGHVMGRRHGAQLLCPRRPAKARTSLWGAAER